MYVTRCVLNGSYIYTTPDSPCFNVDADIVYFNERYEQNEFSILFDELNLRL